MSSHVYPENPEGTQVIVGSMNMGYISDTARNQTHNLFRPKREPIPLGHSDRQGMIPPSSLYSQFGLFFQKSILHCIASSFINGRTDATDLELILINFSILVEIDNFFELLPSFHLPYHIRFETRSIYFAERERNKLIFCDYVVFISI